MTERIALPPAGFDQTNPTDRAILAFANQPPLGCRYLDETNNFTACTVNTTTTLDIRTGKTEYDPYGMVDDTNNRIRILQPGVWDLCVEALVEDTGVADGDQFWVAFLPTSTAITGLLGNASTVVAARATASYRLNIATSLYFTQTALNSNDLFAIRGLCLFNSNDMKIVSFSLLLRSSLPPGKY